MHETTIVAYTESDDRYSQWTAFAAKCDCGWSAWKLPQELAQRAADRHLASVFPTQDDLSSRPQLD